MTIAKQGVLGLAFVLSVAAAYAGPVAISDPVITITASSSLGSASFTANFADGMFFPDPGIFIWNGGGQQLIDPNNQNVIGTIDSAGTTVLLDPVLGITFAVTAGAANTVFTITSALVSFPGITNAEVRATSNFGVNDVSGTLPGASLSGQLGGFAYRTAYNGYVPGGTTFDTQIPGVIAVPPNNSANTGDDSGLAIVPGTISNMSSQVSFALTERDRASGTVNFSVKPEPTTLALLALGALVSARRR
jgi:hypothetical protein